MKRLLIITSGFIAGIVTMATPAVAVVMPAADTSTYEGTISTPILSTGISATVIAAPTASPNAGVYQSSQSVTLTADGSSSIRYTLDGSTPTCSTGTLYAGAISVTTSEVITALSCYPSGVASPVAAFQYAINPPSPASSLSTPNGGGGGGGGGGGSIVSTPATSGLIPGDTNADKKVDVLDFNTVIVHWGETTTGGAASGDLNGDGKVDVLDFNILIVNWSV